MATLGAPIPLTDETRREVRRLDWSLLFATALLITFGLMSMFSVSYPPEGASKPYFIKQAINIAIGLIPFGILAFVHPKVWRRGSSWLYAIDILLLLAVMFMGKHTKGAERWILLPGGVQFQPSELAKLLTVLTLSAFYAHRQERIERLSTFLLGLLHVAVPMGLIFVQPHLGATIVVAVGWFAVSLVAGVPLRYLGGFFACLIALAGAALTVPAVRGKVLKGYQAERIAGLQERKKDVRGKNWQTDRAEIAFGVGGVTGTGFNQGAQKKGGFIPEQHNDFVLTVLGEEGGLVGCLLLLGAYGFFFYRIFLVMLHTTDPFGKMAAGGVFAVLAFHTFVNMAMVLQIVPVVGLWLPFMSYGGTAMWLCLACVGLLLGIRRRERPILF
ncbi:rod shape-determining protein RodA [bacterium]|nr:MAG: rod shape-determining protein RodA [bacterium]